MNHILGFIALFGKKSEGAKGGGADGQDDDVVAVDAVCVDQ